PPRAEPSQLLIWFPSVAPLPNGRAQESLHAVESGLLQNPVAFFSLNRPFPELANQQAAGVLLGPFLHDEPNMKFTHYLVDGLVVLVNMVDLFHSESR